MFTTEDIIQRMIIVHGNKYDYTNFQYNGMHNKSCIICSEHGEFLQTPHSHLKGQGCPKCALKSRSEKRQYNNDVFIEKAKKVHGEKYIYKEVNYVDSQTYVNIICPKHGKFKQKPYLHLQGNGCPLCYNEQRKNIFKKDFNEFVLELKEIYGDKYDFSDYNYVNFKTKSCVVCDKHGEFYRSPYELLHGKDCPICMKKRKKEEDKQKYAYEFIKKSTIIHNGKYDYSKVEYIDCNTPVEIICTKHGSFWQKPTYHMSGNGCQTCANEIIHSSAESELEMFLKELGININTNVRNIISPYELDIYIPDKQIAIEYDGLYWHNELNKDKNYHLMKTELCEKQGIQLIHIFEDEWLEHKEIVKSRLKTILGISNNKVFARNCIVKEVPFNESKNFLIENHLQGNVNAKYRYGLYYNNELVSLMTFGNKRKNLGSKSENGIYEMFRFCNKLDTIVIGGASRLLKHFIKNVKPKEIISYCDRRWFNGNLYEKLGFKFDHYSKPSYFYVKNEKRYNRYIFRKDVLIKEGFDKEKTEHEIMLERGIYRIYDCGTILYKYEASST